MRLVAAEAKLHDVRGGVIAPPESSIATALL
jgi:hypothetical protein